MKMVAEGISTTHAALALGRRTGVELPIATQMAEVLAGRKDARAALEESDAAPPAGRGRWRVIDSIGWGFSIVSSQDSPAPSSSSSSVSTSSSVGGRAGAARPADRRRHARRARRAADLGRRRRRRHGSHPRLPSARARGTARACASWCGTRSSAIFGDADRPTASGHAARHPRSSASTARARRRPSASSPASPRPQGSSRSSAPPTRFARPRSISCRSGPIAPASR